MELLFEYLAAEAGVDPKEAAQTLWRDYRRGDRNDKPRFLKDLLPPDDLAGFSRRKTSPLPKRQARHLS
jgi:hypothetical protein